MDRDFKGVWIPKDIWLNDELNWSEKLLLVEIDSLSSGQKGCFATNEYLGKFLGLSKDRISKLITSLKSKGYIETKIYYKKESKQVEKRVITTKGYRLKCLEGIGENNDTPIGEIDLGGIGENNEDINTDIINTNNINTKDKKIDTSAEAESLDQEKIKFRENINKYISKVEEVTGKNKEEISRVINPSLMKNYDIELLLKKIDESKFLSGKTDTKPKINNFCSKNMIDKILIGFYEDRETKKIQKNLKQKIEKEQYSGEWW